MAAKLRETISQQVVEREGYETQVRELQLRLEEQRGEGVKLAREIEELGEEIQRLSSTLAEEGGSEALGRLELCSLCSAKDEKIAHLQCMSDAMTMSYEQAHCNQLLELEAEHARQIESAEKIASQQLCEAEKRRFDAVNTVREAERNHLFALVAEKEDRAMCEEEVVCLHRCMLLA